VTTYDCPRGHRSAEPDYCGTCGALIGGDAAPARPEPAVGESAAGESAAPGEPVTGAHPCPVCGTPRVGTDRFCENDGYDFVSGRRPEPDPLLTVAAPPAATHGATTAGTAVADRSWTATVAADRSYYDRVSVDGVDFPTVCPPRSFVLTGDSVRVGRRSVTKGVTPEIDLSGPPLDPGISHLHLVLTWAPDRQAWLLTDPGSTNGASRNGATELLAAQRQVELADGDRIHLGAWTTITVHAPG
jgi:FHA domain